MAETNNDWITLGDRTHQNLQLVDALRDQLTYVGHQDDLEKLEKAHLKGSKYEFRDLLFYVQESQRINDGDRSHPRLVELDALALTLTYDGWETDFEGAFMTHKESERDFGSSFKTKVESMRRKQAIFLHDYSHENISFLQTLDVSYPGWEHDVEKAFEDHKRGRSIGYHMFSIPEKQRLFDGDRSHPRLVAVDSLALTYPKWQDDVKEAEKMHFCFMNYNCGVFDAYKSFLHILSSKQRAHESNYGWMHPVKCQILETNWTYPGFESDMEKVRAESSTGHNCKYTFDVLLEKCTLLELIHCGNFHEHPALQKLYQLQLSYPKWEQDFEDAKRHLLAHGYFLPHSFDQKINSMEIKQTVFEGTKTEVDTRSSEKQPSSKTSGFGACVICFDKPRTHLFVPCGHACVCQSCSEKVLAESKRCPICNKGSIIATAFFFP